MAQSDSSNDIIPHFMLESDDYDITKLIAKRIELSIPSLRDKYVAIIPNAFTQNECQELINLSENIGYKDALVNLGFGYKQEMNQFRNHKKLSIDNKLMADFIFNRIKSVIPNEFNNRKVIEINERLRFLRYSPQQYFGPHYDGMYVRENNGERSLITIMIYLNDNYNGGEFTFLHPTNENKIHSIKPQSGMILLFEQNELFHQGSVVVGNKKNIFKYCIRSDIMYSKQIIDNTLINDNDIIKYDSYEVEKQKVYFQRQKLNKSTSFKPDVNKSNDKMNKVYEESITVKVIALWIMEAFRSSNDDTILFPRELYEEIARFCRIIGVLDFICKPNELLELIKVSETAERYQDMVELISELVKINSCSFICYCHNNNDDDYKYDHNYKCTKILDIEERNLLSVAFKNVIGKARSSWRTLNAEISDLKGESKSNGIISTSKENKKEMDQETKKIKLSVCYQYKRIIEQEINEIGCKLLDLLKNNIINKIENCNNVSKETLVFYMKMSGDYNRYLAEIFRDASLYKDKAEKYYNLSLKIGQKNLSANNPTLLGLSLNYSVFLYEIAKETEKACNIAKLAFDEAIADLDNVNDETYKDSTLIMRLLRDNLTLWSSTNNDQ